MHPPTHQSMYEFLNAPEFELGGAEKSEGASSGSETTGSCTPEGSTVCATPNHAPEQH